MGGQAAQRGVGGAYVLLIDAVDMQNHRMIDSYRFLGVGVLDRFVCGEGLPVGIIGAVLHQQAHFPVVVIPSGGRACAIGVVLIAVPFLPCGDAGCVQLILDNKGAVRRQGESSLNRREETVSGKFILPGAITVFSHRNIDRTAAVPADSGFHNTVAQLGGATLSIADELGQTGEGVVPVPDGTVVDPSGELGCEIIAAEELGVILRIEGMLEEGISVLPLRGGVVPHLQLEGDGDFGAQVVLGDGGAVRIQPLLLVVDLLRDGVFDGACGEDAVLIRVTSGPGFAAAGGGVARRDRFLDLVDPGHAVGRTAPVRHLPCR